MWRKYFNIKGIKPGPVVYPAPFNKIDFRSENLNPDTLFAIYEAGHPYLVLTDEGFEHYYGDKKEPVQEQKAVFTAKELIDLIKKSTTKDQAFDYYKLGIQFKSVQKAYESKVLEFES